MKLFIRIIAPVLAVMMIGSCTGEQAVITTEELTVISDSPTETVEVSDTEAITDEETTAEETTADPFNGMSAADLLIKSEHTENSYSSFIRRYTTKTAITASDITNIKRSSSELRVSNGNASFVRKIDDDYEQLFLVGDELYYETSDSKLRIGGNSLAEFLDLVSDPISLGIFGEGEITVLENGAELFFSSLGDNGEEILRSMLGLSETHILNIKRSELKVLIDSDANAVSGTLSLSLSVSEDQEELMSVTIDTTSEQSDIGAEVDILLPEAAEYIFFSSNTALELYRSALPLVYSFPKDYNKFEFTVQDDMLIQSDALNISLTSSDRYAYSNTVGMSLERKFNTANNAGIRQTLTFYNFRSCFGRIDNGMVFDDPSVNKNNIDETLAYPFKTSFYGIGYCTGMIPEMSDESTLAFYLNDDICRNIAANMLIHAGVTETDIVLGEDTAAHTFITLNKNGELAAVGYCFSSSVNAGGKTYRLERTVTLNIISNKSANVKTLKKS